MHCTWSLSWQGKEKYLLHVASSTKSFEPSAVGKAYNGDKAAHIQVPVNFKVVSNTV